MTLAVSEESRTTATVWAGGCETGGRFDATLAHVFSWPVLLGEGGCHLDANCVEEAEGDR